MMEIARSRRFKPYFMVGALFLSVPAFSEPSPRPSAASSLAPAPSSALAELSTLLSADGSIVLVTVHSLALKDATRISASLEETKDIPFYPVDANPGTYQAVVAVPFNHAPGKINIQVYLPPPLEQVVSLPLEVVDGHYRSETLKVDEKKVVPPAKDAKRIVAEQEEIKGIYEKVTRTKYWEGPFAMPVKSLVTSPFGSKRVYNGEMKNFHQGLDLRARIGTPIHAPAPGQVVLAKNLFFTGNTVLLDHGYGVFTLYGHMSRLEVKKGDLVKTGTTLGLAGMTGRANGPHLHWGAVIHKLKVNPIDLTKVMR